MTKPIALAIEMNDTSTAKYGVIHAAGCRDLRDPEPIGEASTIAEANQAADDTTGWEYVPTGDGYRLAPCAMRPLQAAEKDQA